MRTIRNTARILILILILVSIPVGVLAQNTQGQFIPCGLYDSASKTLDECDFYDLLKLVQNVLNWLVMVSFSVAIITFSWAGFILLTSGGNVAQKDKAKKMLWSIVKGFAIILAAWLIVRTIVNTLLVPGIGDRFIKF